MQVYDHVPAHAPLNSASETETAYTSASSHTAHSKASSSMTPAPYTVRRRRLSPEPDEDEDDRPAPSEYGDDELDGQSAISYGGTLTGGPQWRAGSIPMGSSREGSVAASDYSYSSSADREWILRELHGRTINNTSETYMFPADVDEHSRLDLQHALFRAKVGSLFVPKQQVRRILRPRTLANGDKYAPQVLDIGTGSGRWVVEMAREYPHAQFVGMDLAPANLSLEAPSNCRFECDDANLGLAHYKNTFDIIHIRCASGGIRDWHQMLREMEAALKPGGILLTFGAGSLNMYDENYDEITDLTEDGHEDDPGRKFTWMNKVCDAMRIAMTARNPGAMDHQMHTVRWLREMDCWKEVGSRTYFTPIGPWEANLSPRDKYVADLQKRDFLEVASTFRPLLITHGYFEETVDKWIEKSKDELINVRKKQYVKWFASWAVKRG